MIPAEAVEAAMDVVLDDGLVLKRSLVHDLLEAAAPYMLAVQWGVRDRDSLQIAGHPNEESARGTAAARPEWYEVVSRPMPGLWTTNAG